MRKEIIVVGKDTGRINYKDSHDLQYLQLSRRDIFASDEHAAFTDLGVYLYALFVVHKGAIREALNNSHISDTRLEQLLGKETENRYIDLENVWGKKIPRDSITSSYLEEKVVAMVSEQSILLHRENGSSLTKR